MVDIFAFPVPHCIDGNWVKTPLDEYCGMTLRDYFAAQALGGCEVTTRKEFGFEPAHEIAKRCYQIADAMLEVRKND